MKKVCCSWRRLPRQDITSKDCSERWQQPCQGAQAQLSHLLRNLISLTSSCQVHLPSTKQRQVDAAAETPFTPPPQQQWVRDCNSTLASSSSRYTDQHHTHTTACKCTRWDVNECHQWQADCKSASTYHHDLIINTLVVVMIIMNSEVSVQNARQAGASVCAVVGRGVPFCAFLSHPFLFLCLQPPPLLMAGVPS